MKVQPSTSSGAPSYPLRTKIKVGVSLVLLLVAMVLVVRAFSGEDAGDASRRRVAVDSLTGEVFRVVLKGNESLPWKNPKTGDNTLYPGEACYWNRDGTAKLQPTYVFVKAYAGIKEKTFCPECGKEVRRHNPLPPDELMAKAAENAGK